MYCLSLAGVDQYQAGTPGLGNSGMGGGEDLGLWAGVLVSLPGSAGQQAVVRGVGGDGRLLVVQPGSSVPGSAFEAQGGEQVLDRQVLTLVLPQKKDRVKLLRDSETGIAAGKTGVLIGIDGPDGIVKCDGSGSDMQIFNMMLLGKLALLL